MSLANDQLHAGETGDSNNADVTQRINQAALDQLFTYENEIRWIYCWNAWIKILQRKHHEFLPPERDTQKLNELEITALFQDFQTSYDNVALPNSPEHVRELILILKIWMNIRKQTILLLSEIEILTSDSKSDVYKSLSSMKKVEIEVDKKRLMEAITASHEKEKKYRNQLSHDAAAMKIAHQKNQETDIEPLMNTVFKILFQENSLEKKYSYIIPTTESYSYKRKNKYLNIPEFHNPLLVGRSENEEGTTISDLPSHVNKVSDILQIGTEWYLAWTVFTEELLCQINLTLPSSVSKVALYENTITNGQMALLKSFLVEVETFKEASSTTVGASCLTALDCFINLFEKVKEEIEFWANNIDGFLKELGETDLTNVSLENTLNYKTFLFKIAIQDKNRHVHLSLLYLYKTINKLVDYIKSTAPGEGDYAVKLEGITESLQNQYASDRKEKMGPVPLETDKTYPRIEYPEDENLEEPQGISPEMLMKMSFDNAVPSYEEKFWSDSMTYSLDEDPKLEEETLEKMKYFANMQSGNSSQEEKKDQSRGSFIDNLEDSDKLYGAQISPELVTLVEQMNVRLESQDYTQKDEADVVDTTGNEKKGETVDTEKCSNTLETTRENVDSNES